MSALQLSINRLNPLLATFPPNIQKQANDVYLALCEFLQPHSGTSYPMAAIRMLNKFPDHFIDFTALNAVVCELAQQIPFAHYSMRKLALLVWTIGRSKRRLEMASMDVRSSP